MELVEKDLEVRDEQATAKRFVVEADENDVG